MFGDTLVESTSEDLSQAAVFASIQGDDDGTVTAVLSNKDDANTETAVISLDGTDTSYESVAVYAITQDSTDIRLIDVQNDIENNQLTVELPPLSVAQIVISNTATDLTPTEEPDITTETTVYTYDELEISENVFPMIPLGDQEHLDHIVIRTTVTSDSGSTWASGGGALCFNQMVWDGIDSGVWGYKPFSYHFGTNDNVVAFDDSFHVIADDGSASEISGSCNDTYAELQNWWVSSESDPSGGSNITMTIDSVTLVYVYENTQSDVLCGDCTGDGVFDAADLVLIQKWMLQMPNTTLNQWKAADCIADGKIDGLDLCEMRRLLIE
ncbi:MAG: dockerin type I repeat-containing protein [Ruminococcus sp.]|nr:dockerin type I repeat-containing protein [Ruminococcus sp.]